MRVIVTGATGFLGRRFCCTLLEHGHTLIGLNRTGRSDVDQNPIPVRYVPYIMGDALPRVVIDFSPQVLVHLAWDGIPNFSEEKCLENVESQLRFFKETERLSDLKKIVVAGTCREYGDKQGPCIESERFSPDSYFSWAKQTLRDYLMLSCQKRAVSMLWFRLFYVYGPGQRAGSLIPTLIKAFKTNTNPEISNPSACNDYIYIDDVVSALVKAIENEGCSGTFNLGSGHTSTVAEIAKLVEYAIRNSDRFSSQLSEKLCEAKSSPSMWADISISSQHLSWQPKISLAEGISRTCQLGNYE